MENIVQPDFTKDPSGLIPAIVQDWQTGEVLMLAYINNQAWKATLDTGLATYWSRSRQELWVKGAVSGHLQHIKQVLIDCDRDTVIFKVEQIGGAACHVGYRSCFFTSISQHNSEIVGDLVFDSTQVYKK